MNVLFYLIFKHAVCFQRFNANSVRLNIATVPYQALLEGVFLDLSQAQNYLATFQKYSPQAAGKIRRNIAKPYPFDPEILNPMMQVCFCSDLCN